MELIVSWLQLAYVGFKLHQTKNNWITDYVKAIPIKSTKLNLRL
jgi:hypothetical protein